jgi:hypothetical protein
MVSKPNMDPNKPPVQGPKPPPSLSNTEFKAWNPPPLNWMGMKFNEEQTKQLWMTISQTVGQAIQKDRDRMIEASKRLRRSTDLENEDDS